MIHFVFPKFKSLAVPFSISSWSKPQQLGYLTSCMSFSKKLVSLLMLTVILNSTFGGSCKFSVHFLSSSSGKIIPLRKETAFKACCKFIKVVANVIFFTILVPRKTLLHLLMQEHSKQGVMNNLNSRWDFLILSPNF